MTISYFEHFIKFFFAYDNLKIYKILMKSLSNIYFVVLPELLY